MAEDSSYKYAYTLEDWIEYDDPADYTPGLRTREEFVENLPKIVPGAKAYLSGRHGITIASDDLNAMRKAYITLIFNDGASYYEQNKYDAEFILEIDANIGGPTWHPAAPQPIVPTSEEAAEELQCQKSIVREFIKWSKEILNRRRELLESYGPGELKAKLRTDSSPAAQMLLKFLQLQEWHKMHVFDPTNPHDIDLDKILGAAT